MAEPVKVTMKYIGKWQVGIGVLTIGLGFGIISPTSAQPPDLALICYMQLPNRAIVNLAKLCGDRTLHTRPRSAAERKAQFLKDFDQQIHTYPEGAAIAAAADPDALIGKANLACQALQLGDYPPHPVATAPEQSQFRRLADLEEAVVAQVAQRGFCPDLAKP